MLRRGNQQNIPDTRQHQRGERIVDHRFVINREKLFAHGERKRVEPGSGTSCEDDAFHFHTNRVLKVMYSLSKSVRWTARRFPMFLRAAFG